MSICTYVLHSLVLIYRYERLFISFKQIAGFFTKLPNLGTVYMNRPGWVVSRKSFHDSKGSFELTLCSSYSQTKPALLWNIILGVCSSRNKNFVKRISPTHHDRPLYKPWFLAFFWRLPCMKDKNWSTSSSVVIGFYKEPMQTGASRYLRWSTSV